jgi:hypothetical protein
MKVYSSEHNEEELRPKITITYDNDDPVHIEHKTNGAIGEISFKKLNESLMIFLPNNLDYRVDTYTASGRNVSSFAVNGKNQWYLIPVMNSTGIHIIRIASSAGTVIKKVNHFK